MSLKKKKSGNLLVPNAREKVAQPQEADINVIDKDSC